MVTRLAEFASSRAVLIGTGSYVHDDLVDLPAVEHNLTDLRDLLTDPAVSGFAPTAVQVVRDPAGGREVMDPILTVAAEATDLVVVYLAGHGLLMGDNAELHIATRETVPRHPWTGLAFHHIARALRRSRADVKILLLDCCYSGRAARDLMGDEVHLATDQVAVDGVYVMTSTSGHQTARAPIGHRHTAFTGGLLEIMQHGLADGGAVLDMFTLYGALRTRMARDGWPLPEQYHSNNAAVVALVRNTHDRQPVQPLTAAMLSTLPLAEAASAFAAASVHESVLALAGVEPQLAARILQRNILVVSANRIRLTDTATAGKILAAAPSAWVADLLSTCAIADRARLLATLAPPHSDEAVRQMTPSVLLNAVSAAADPEQATSLHQLITQARPEGRDLFSPDRIRPGQPAIARRRLRRLLRRIRHDLALTQRDVTESLNWPPAKISRLERGDSRAVAIDDIERLADRYGLGPTDQRRSWLSRLAIAAAEPAWWEPYRHVMTKASESMVSLDNGAIRMQLVSFHLVPGILQTPGYIEAVLTGHWLVGDQVRPRTDLRLRRQVEIFDRDDPPEVTAIIHERALQRDIGGHRVMLDQLAHLHTAAHRPNLRLHILPDAASYPSIASDFVITFIDTGHDDGLVYLETAISDSVTGAPADVVGFTRLFTDLVQSAMDTEQSLAFLRRLIDET